MWISHVLICMLDLAFFSIYFFFFGIKREAPVAIVYIRPWMRRGIPGHRVTSADWFSDESEAASDWGYLLDWRTRREIHPSPATGILGRWEQPWDISIPLFGSPISQFTNAISRLVAVADFRFCIRLSYIELKRYIPPYIQCSGVLTGHELLTHSQTLEF